MKKATRIKIIAISDVCHYTKLIGKEFDLEPEAPHTSDSWAFTRAKNRHGNTWFMIHKNLTDIVAENNQPNLRT